MRTGKRPAGTKGRGRPGNRKPSRCRNPCRGRCLHRPGNPASPQGLREGHGPPLQTGGDAWLTGKPRPCVITNLCRGRFHIGPVRGGVGSRGRDESRPYNRRRVRGRPGKCQPHAAATPVGDDACIVPGPCGGADARGRDESRPYEYILCFGQTGTATATRAAVGRDASSRRTPRRRKVPRADMESAPTTGGGCAVGRENANLTLPHPCARPLGILHDFGAADKGRRRGGCRNCIDGINSPYLRQIRRSIHSQTGGFVV